MDRYIVLNETIYPHMRLEDWEAPSLEVAQRWVDEVRARGDQATIVYKWNGHEQKMIVRVGYVVSDG